MAETRYSSTGRTSTLVQLIDQHAVPFSPRIRLTAFDLCEAADIGSSAKEISYLDFGSDDGVRQYTGINSLPQAHAIQRPRTNVNMQGMQETLLKLVEADST